MNLESDEQLMNTKHKLAQLESQIAKAQAKPITDANLASVRSLVQMANQLREEIVRYQSQGERVAS